MSEFLPNIAANSPATQRAHSLLSAKYAASQTVASRRDASNTPTVSTPTAGRKHGVQLEERLRWSGRSISGHVGGVASAWGSAGLSSRAGQRVGQAALRAVA